IETADGARATVPDELRISVYGDHGVSFAEQRLPETGPLVPLGPTVLGTVTVYLPSGSRSARFDVLGVVAGQARLRGTTSSPVVTNRQVAATVVLDTAAPPDGDGDGVGDASEAAGDAGADHAPPDAGGDRAASDAVADGDAADNEASTDTAGTP